MLEYFFLLLFCSRTLSTFFCYEFFIGKKYIELHPKVSKYLECGELILKTCAYKFINILTDIKCNCFAKKEEARKISLCRERERED